MTDHDRATVPALTYVLAIGITTVLISGLLVAGTGFLNDERERVVREELTVIGERVAVDVHEADRLASNGGTVRLSVTIPEAIGETPYRIRVTDCPAGDACLELLSADPDVDVSATVPLHNETPIAVERSGPRAVTVSANPSGHLPSTADADVRVNPNIGVAEEIVRGDSTGVTFNGSVAPVAQGFFYAPSPPAIDENITFQSNVGKFSNTELTYKWDFDGDGTFETTGDEANASTVTHSYSSPGRYDVTLEVNDTTGATDRVTRTVRVSGLLYEGNTSAAAIDFDSNDDDAGLEFEITNNFNSEDITINDITIEPDSTSVERVNNFPATIVIDGDNVYTEQIFISDGGGIAGVDEDPEVPKVGDVETVTVKIGEFLDDDGDEFGTFGHEFTFGFRYTIDGTKRNFVSEFTVDPSSMGGGGGGGAGNPPSVDNAISCKYGDSHYAGGNDYDGVVVSDPDGDLDKIRVTVFNEDGDFVGSYDEDVSGSNDDEYVYLGEWTSFRDYIEITVADQNGNTDTVTRDVTGGSCFR